jgi:hypothetical protein
MADMQPLRLQVIEQINSRDATLNYDSKLVNGLIEQGQIGMRAVKRAGYSLAFQGEGGTGQGIYNYNGTLYGVSSDFLNQYGGDATIAPVQIQSNAAFSARQGAAVAGFLGQLYLFGGVNASGVLSDAWTSIDGITWNPLSGAPANRSYGKAIVLNNVLFLMGGLNSAGTYLNDVWSTPDGVTWTEVTANAPWGGRTDFEVQLFNGSIYLAGGQGYPGPNSGVPNSGLWHDVWTTPDGTNWTVQNPSCPWIGRRRFGFFNVGTTMYVLGGFMGFGTTNTTFQNAVSDQWASTNNGVTWTRVNTNPFNVGGCPMYPFTVITSIGIGAVYGTGVTVTNGASGGGAAAYAYTDSTEGESNNIFNDYSEVKTVTFTTVGSGYTTPCTFVCNNEGTSIPAVGYAFMDGTSVSGGRSGEVVYDPTSGLYYFFTTYINGAQSNEIWTAPDGVTWTLFTSAPGYATRSMIPVVYGDIFIIGGYNSTANTYYNDVWALEAGSTSYPLSPTVPNEFYNFNQTSNGLATPYLVFKSAHQGYYFSAALASLNRITSANYPAVTVYGLVYLDTTFYVMDPNGKIWGSNLNDPTNWTALNEIAIQNEPDGGVGIAKVGPYLVGFGQWSCEFFYDNANAAPGSPLSANSTLAYQVGCAVGRSICEMEGSVIWVGQTSTEGAKVYVMQGYTPVVVSTPFVDRIIQNDPLTLVQSFATTHFGHPLYVLTLLTTGVTLVYDFGSQDWYTWWSSTPAAPVTVTSISVAPLSSSTYALALASTAPLSHGLQDGDPVVISNTVQPQYTGLFNVTVTGAQTFQYVISATATPETYATVQSWQTGPFLPIDSAELTDVGYMQDPSNGNVYALSYATGSDNGNPIDFNVVTPRWDGGVMAKKFIRRVSIVGDATSSNVMVRRSETDYQNWMPYRMIWMQASWPFASALGMTTRTAFQLRHTAFTPQRLEALEIEIETGVA